MTNRQRAEKIYRTLQGAKALPLLSTPDRDIKFIAAQLDEAVGEAVRKSHYELAQKQANVMGESVMLCGKLVTNEELYKQPTDYVKEAYAEGFSAAREKAAKLTDAYADVGREIGKAIRALSPDEGKEAV